MDDTPSRLRRASQVRLRAKAKNRRVPVKNSAFSAVSRPGVWRAWVDRRSRAHHSRGLALPSHARREHGCRSRDVGRWTGDDAEGWTRVRRALAGAPIAWGEDAVPAGGVAGVLQELAPKLSRAERVLEEMEACRNEFHDSIESSVARRCARAHLCRFRQRKTV